MFNTRIEIPFQFTTQIRYSNSLTVNQAMRVQHNLNKAKSTGKNAIDKIKC